MTFDELRLLVAIQRANVVFRDGAADRERLQVCKEVAATFADLTGDVEFPFDRSDVWLQGVSWRKSQDKRTKAEVAFQHGFMCFWVGRGKGPCSDEAEVGHLVPRCHGGELTVANCIIECRNHNNQRRELTIEEYLSCDRVAGASQ